MLRVLTLSSLFPDATRPNFGVFVERQAMGLAAHSDVEVTVVAPIGLPPWPLRRLERFASLAALPVQESWNGIEVHRPRFTTLPGTSGRFHPALLTDALRPVLRNLEFDVIDASFFYPDGPAAVALGREFGVPVSVKARGADIHHWGSAPATRQQVIAAGCDADGMLAVSAALKNSMIRMGMPEERIAVHYTGVDLDRFAPGDRIAAKRALRVRGPLVLSVGALIPRKGHDLVIEAIALLPDVTLMIAGEGGERDALVALAKRLAVSDRVRLLGSVPHAELPALFAAADVMALASASEGLANAWVEALASGTPIVISDVGGARELVDRPAAGQIVERSRKGMAGGIATLLMAPPPTTAVRAAAERFTWEANTAALYEHLAGLVAARNPRRH